MSVLSQEEALRRSRAPSIASIRNLNCWGCGLNDVSVLTAAENLEVLNLRYSRISIIWYLTNCVLSLHAAVINWLLFKYYLNVRKFLLTQPSSSSFHPPLPPPYHLPPYYPSPLLPIYLPPCYLFFPFPFLTVHRLKLERAFSP